MINLDNASTTPIYNELLDVVRDTAVLGNPSSGHAYGKAAKKIVEDSRNKIANLLGANEKEIYFTSSGTESNNTVLFGAKLDKSKRVIVSDAEHSSVYYAAKRLQNLGFKVEFAPVDSIGRVRLDCLENMLSDDVAIVSIMHVNNETGSVNDIKTIAKLVKKLSPAAIMHSDGVQAAGKFPIDLHSLGVDCYSISAHKFRALKGVGALYIKSGVRLNPLIYGGGQERGMRSATENIAGIACMAKGLELFMANYDQNYIKSLASRFLAGLVDLEKEYITNSNILDNPNIISIAIKGARGEVIQNVLSDKGVMLATGSACASNKASDRIAKALAVPKSFADGMLRISFSMENTFSDIDTALLSLKDSLKYFK